MTNINENIAKNITKLRKLNNLTQIDLANKLNYSDKAISKWERGESVPDITMLNNLASLFNVNIDYLVKEHNDIEIEKTKENKQTFIRNLLIAILFCVSAFLISTTVFAIFTFNNPSNAKTMWVSFVAATPLCSLTFLIYGKKLKNWLMELISISSLLWTVLTTLFCVLLVLNFDAMLWLIYIVGVPIQGIICLFYFWKKTF